MKVAIVQNQVGIDGRSRVIGEIVVALNELGVTPDVYTLSTAGRRRTWLEVLMAGRLTRCRLPGQGRLPLRRGYAHGNLDYAESAGWESQHRDACILSLDLPRVAQVATTLRSGLKTRVS